jgi:Subtilase family
MKRLLTAIFLVTAMVGCAALPMRPAPAMLPPEVQADPDRYLVVTIRNVTAPLPMRAGSTKRSYDAAGAYSVSGTTQSLALGIAADYDLVEVAAWPIAVLRVHCLVFRIPAGATRDALLARLAVDPRVQLAQPLQTFATSAAGYNDRYVSLQRSFAEMSVPAAHRWSRGEGVVVAVIDSGVDAKHPDLTGRVRAVRSFVNPEAASRVDLDSHGTEVAGVIAAVGNNGEGIVGVAPGVELLVLQACWHTGATDSAAVCNTFTLAQALAAAITAGADVINLSLVGPADTLLGALTARATALGAIVVGAVPGSGRMDGFPAGAPGVIAVDMAESAVASSQAVRAPGSEILTLAPGGGYDFATGSSLAAGNVSGIVALIRARRHLTAAQAQALLAASMRSVASSTGVIHSIDACAALAASLDKSGCPVAPDPDMASSLRATREGRP